MSRRLWAEEIALAMSLRDCGWSWCVIGREVGCAESTIIRSVKEAKRTGFRYFPSRFGRTA